MSSTLIRRAWSRRRRMVSQSIEEKRPRRDLWEALVGMPRASMLLIAYATEMFLKSGICRLYKNCNDYVVHDETKRLGHKLDKLAVELSLGLSSEELVQLGNLAKLITDARYPVVAHDQATYIRKKNTQTHEIWNDKGFVACRKLVQKIRTKVCLIDRDYSNPSSHRHIPLGNGGYIAFRTGGHLPTRITFESDDANVDVRWIEEAIFADPRLIEMQLRWKQTSVYRFEKGKIGKRSTMTLLRSIG